MFERRGLMSRLAAKINALETAVNASIFSSAAVRLVKSGRCYDELNDSEKDLYSQYRNIPRDVLEAVEFAVNGSLDFPLQLKPNEPLVKIVNEVEKLITEM